MEHLKHYLAHGTAWAFRAVFEPGAVKTPAMTITGLVLSVKVKEMAQYLAAIGTALIVIIHLALYLIKIWCPARRARVVFLSQVAENICTKCPLQGSLLCPYGMSEKD